MLAGASLVCGAVMFGPALQGGNSFAQSEFLDAAPFGRVITCDPDRTQGSRANRIQEYRAKDVFLETELRPDSQGHYAVPAWANGTGCIGLKWLESRRLKELGITFASGSAQPSAESVQVQCWVGESAWQGSWKPLPAAIERKADRWILRPNWADIPEARGETRKTRFVISPSSESIVVRRMSALTPTRLAEARLLMQLEKPIPGTWADVELYNGAIITGGDSHCRRYHKWDLGRPLRLKVRYGEPAPWKSDRTVIRFRLPGGAFGVAVDDVLSRDAVLVRGVGLFVAQEPAKLSLDQYRSKIAGQETVLQQVRRLPDQTFAQAMKKVHRPCQDLGPILLSLACDNHKVVVQRAGTILSSASPEADDRMVSKMLDLAFQIVPTFGSGSNEHLSRHLDGGWLPIPVTTVKESDVVYQQRTFVAPYGGETYSQVKPMSATKALCVAEYSIDNTAQAPADVSLELKFLADAGKDELAEVRSVPTGAVAYRNGRLLAYLETSGAETLKTVLGRGTLALAGTLPPRTKAGCVIYVPRWKMQPEGHVLLKDGGGLRDRVEAYWVRATAPAMQIEVPDRFLMNVIRASRVHCLLTARNEGEGARIAPWIASDRYGPLESESNSVIRGMDFLGHHDFARRSLEFFIHRYNRAGFLTTGYTVMGTGWHLWMLGEHYDLTQDSQWLNQVAEEVVRVCRWMVRQREKTKRLGPDGEKVPEYGLMPPGVMADWNAFAYYFCLNGYFHAGLQSVSRSLAEIGHPEADNLLRGAAELREEILRAYRWTQSRMPVYPLKDGTSVPGYPSQLYCPGPTDHFFPGQDSNRSWAYDVELGAHHLVPLGVLDADSRDAEWMVEHMEDVQFLHEGWFDYPADASHHDPFNLGGFSKVQPYYCRNAEVYAMRDDVKPFVRSYFNMISSLVSREILSFWEHFHGAGAWNKTHETGYFLHQTRMMLVMERGDSLWLAPLITGNWLKDGMAVAIRNAPTRFGPVSYRINSSVESGYIEAVVQPPTRSPPDRIVLRLRHPQGKQMQSVLVDGTLHPDFDPVRECVRFVPVGGQVTVRVSY